MPLQIKNLGKHYGNTTVFDGLNLTLAAGEFVAIVGESGSGKSTLLNCMAGLDVWDRGSIELDGTDIGSLNDEQRTLLRRHKIGFVFQAFHVLPHLDVAQNVALPLLLLKQEVPEWQIQAAVDQRVNDMLQAVGLQGFNLRLPQTLSGGQLQRVAIARALVHRPTLLLADEPTGNLDGKTAALVMQALLDQTRAHGASLVLVTHSEAATVGASQVLHLS